MEPVNVNFQIKGIELLEINLQHPQIILNPERTYNFNINIEQRINNAEKLVIAITSVDLIHEEDQQCHASIKTSCIFSIENFQDFLVENTNDVKLPDQLIVTLNSISLSTTRGIMFTSFKGTFMHNVFLPIVNPSSFVTQNKM
ncbi:MAG TPA: hypothetical protein DCL77_03450 [Prolixibacteraceae bacterium]|jgi:hypothetical protein|nr:hypothetical protein [Prolixibacteraceae bacterium]